MKANHSNVITTFFKFCLYLSHAGCKKLTPIISVNVSSILSPFKMPIFS